MRAMAMDFGDALLVCPVYEYGCRSRRLYLPAGRWYETHSGAVFESEGAWFDVPAPYGWCPVFAKAGSVVPHGEAVEYTSAPSSGALELYVYAGADGDFTLYEDDGVSYAYENGACSRILLHWDDASRRLDIGAREGSFESMPSVRSISVRLHCPEGTVLSESIDYDGTPVSINLSNQERVPY